jgi:ribonuclease HII
VVCIEPAECDALGMHVANVMALRMALSRLDVAPTYVLTDGFSVDGLWAPGTCDLEGRSGGGMRSGCVDHRQGDSRQNHVRARSSCIRVRVRRAQGLLHAIAPGKLDAYGPSATHRMRFVNVSRTARVELHEHAAATRLGERS